MDVLLLAGQSNMEGRGIRAGAAGDVQHVRLVAACAAVGVDDSAADVSAIHALTRDIAHGVARPMAPVSNCPSASTVGLPRESSISLATTPIISLMFPLHL